MTAFSTIKSAIEAIKMGAYYFLPKPFEYDELDVIVSRAVQDMMMIKKDSFITQIKEVRKSFVNKSGLFIIKLVVCIPSGSAIA